MSDALRVVLIAHDGCKDSLVDWAHFNRLTLSRCEVIATQSTGKAVQAATGLNVRLLLSGPLGGDAQAGAMIATGEADLVVFFWDPLAAQPHDVDVKALIRVAVVHDVPIACNRASADLLISSPLFRSYHTYRAERDTPIERRAF
jgi:methylglyoxal synthase